MQLMVHVNLNLNEHDRLLTLSFHFNILFKNLLGWLLLLKTKVKFNISIDCLLIILFLTIYTAQVLKFSFAIGTFMLCQRIIINKRIFLCYLKLWYSTYCANLFKCFNRKKFANKKTIYCWFIVVNLLVKSIMV